MNIFLQVGQPQANLVLSLTEYFGIPFIEPSPVRRGVVNVSFGTLNIREKPSRTSRILASIPNGAPLTIFGQWQGWYVVNYRGLVGYVDSRYVNII